MDKERIQEFTVRVTQASKTELVVILYDIILTDIVESKKLLALGDESGFVKELKHSLRCLNELMATLDYSIPISHDLLSLYSFSNKTIIEAMMKKTVEGLDSAASVLTKLRTAFNEISKSDTDGPVMENTQQVYAGLTYGKGTLNESYLTGYEHNRGFKA